MNLPERQRILFILPNLNVGGAERVMIEIMNNIERDSFFSHLITLNSQGPLRSQISKDIELHNLGSRSTLSAVLSLYKEIRKQHPHIVISTMARVNFMTLLLRPFFPQTRFFAREAALPSMIFVSRPKIKPLIRLLYRLLYPLADGIISPSQAIMDEFKNLGLSMKNHVRIYNPVNIRALRSVPHAFDIMANIKSVRFIAAGTLYWPKGFDRLIETLSRMNAHHDWHLTILGDGPDRVLLENLIKHHKLESHIKLRGFVESPSSFYAMADCFLLPSRTEGLPNVALEALACGTRVIAMREAGGITDIAARAAENNVILTETMEDFISEMGKVTPSFKTKAGPSLLPPDFELETVIDQYSALFAGDTLGKS